MSRFVLKYVYYALGLAMALPSDRMTQSERMQAHDEAMKPMEAAEYYANAIVDRPLGTLARIVGYQLVFAGPPICAAYTEELSTVLGGFPELIGGLFEEWVTSAVFGSQVSQSTLELLPIVGAGVGLFFFFIVHQSLRTASSIRLYLSQGGELF
jgi:hypothetical protein